MDVSEAKLLKQLEDENSKLKKLLADAMLDASALRELLAKKKMVGPAAQRDGVAHLMAVKGLSERRAGCIVGADRKMSRYKPRRPAETELRGRLRDLANERERFGYRRLFILCGRRAKRRASIASTGCTARKASRCVSAARDGVPSELVLRSS